MTLILALALSDLGIVLSVCGSISGSCLAYIGPGLAFLGVNSTAFLEWVHTLLRRREERRERQKKQTTHSSKLHSYNIANSSDSFLKVPLVEQGAVAEDSGTEIMIDCFDARTVHKPLWWYFLGFSTWYRLAINANVKMKENMLARNFIPENEISGEILLDANALTEEHLHEGEISEFSSLSVLDFLTSLFLILFGVIGLSAGLFSYIAALL